MGNELTPREVHLVRSLFAQVRAMEITVNQMRSQIDLLSSKIGHGISPTESVRQGEARASLHDLLRIGAELTGASFDEPKHIGNDSNNPVQFRVCLWNEPWMLDQYGRCHAAPFVAVEATGNRHFAPKYSYWRQT